MDEGVLSLSSSSSLSSAAGKQRDISPKSDGSVPQNQQGHKSAEELRYVLYVQYRSRKAIFISVILFYIVQQFFFMITNLH